MRSHKCWQCLTPAAKRSCSSLPPTGSRDRTHQAQVRRRRRKQMSKWRNSRHQNPDPQYSRRQHCSVACSARNTNPALHTFCMYCRFYPSSQEYPRIDLPNDKDQSEARKYGTDIDAPLQTMCGERDQEPSAAHTYWVCVCPEADIQPSSHLTAHSSGNVKDAFALHGEVACASADGSGNGSHCVAEQRAEGHR